MCFQHLGDDDDENYYDDNDAAAGDESVFWKITWHSTGGWELGIGGGGSENGGGADEEDGGLANEVEPGPPAKEAGVELGKEVDGGKEEAGGAKDVVEVVGKVEKLVVLPTKEAAAWERKFVKTKLGIFSAFIYKSSSPKRHPLYSPIPELRVD